MPNKFPEIPVSVIDASIPDLLFDSPTHVLIDLANKKIREAYRRGLQRAEKTSEDSEDLFYIQDARSYCGNSVMWWRVDGQGYTSNLAEAWKVPGTWKCRDTDKLWPCEAIDSSATRQFDMQLLRGIK